MSDSEDERECPPCPASFIRLPPETRQVLDADEEVSFAAFPNRFK